MDILIVTAGLLGLASGMCNVHLNSPAHKKCVEGIILWLLVSVSSAVAVATVVVQ